MSTEKTSTKRALTAYHEAGHAVASVYKRVAFRYVTIKENADSLGHLQHAQFSAAFCNDVSAGVWGDATVLRLERLAFIAFAGPAAAAEKRGLKSLLSARGAREDFRDAVEYLDRACGGGSEEELNALIKLTMIRARQFVRCAPKWEGIRAVAEALLEHETLSSRAVRRLTFALPSDFRLEGGA